MALLHTINRTNDWWALDNMLLVHGITNWDTKGKYEKDPKSPWPKSGEFACSIISPITQAAYASEGLILSPTRPVRLSYTDVGSYFVSGSDAAKGARAFKGKMWTAEEMSLKDLMFLTLAGAFYNDVHIDTRDTKIIGCYSSYATVDEFVQQTVDLAQLVETVNDCIPLAQTMCTAGLSSDFLTNRPMSHATQMRLPMFIMDIPIVTPTSCWAAVRPY